MITYIEVAYAVMSQVFNACESETEKKKWKSVLQKKNFYIIHKYKKRVEIHDHL